MNSIEIHDMTYHVPHKTICDKINLVVPMGAKVALVAKNGAGKSTLLNLIAGKLHPFAGSVEIPGWARVGYLAQAEDFDPTQTVLDTLFVHASELGQLIQAYEHALATDADNLEDLVYRIGEVDGRSYETQVQIIINKLQLRPLLEQPVATCSGGELKRLALAKVLLDEPDILLLDEPTNHLDVDMIRWLEQYLQQLQAAVVLVTHDRYILERVCSTIIELDKGDIFSYPGNYTKFLELKAKREEDYEQQRHELKQFLKKEHEWMVKMPRARESKSVKRQKEFAELQSSYAAMKRQSLDHRKRLDISLVKRRIGGKVLQVHNISKSFGEKVLVKDFSYNFRAGERVGLIGPNGVGKSTFIKLLAQQLAPDTGTIKQGSTITMGLYQQKQRPLNGSKKVLDIVKDVREYIQIGGGKRVSATQMLEQFMFPPRQQHQKASLLSGGEKRRLSLLLTLLDNPNFLILDEPTNDLDIMTLGMLEDFLQAYTGCLVVISHDRMFMDRVVDHVFVFEGAGVITDFPGNYSAWATMQEQKALEQDSADDEDTSRDSCIDYAASAQKKKSLSNKERDRYQWLSEEIERLEKSNETINTQLAAGDVEHKQIKELAALLAENTATISQYEEERLILAERT